MYVSVFFVFLVCKTRTRKMSNLGYILMTSQRDPKHVTVPEASLGKVLSEETEVQ